MLKQRTSRVPCTAQALIGAVQALSHARTHSEVAAVVRVAARELTGADGATFVLRDGDLCYYAEENAIAPLWKGRRFPMSACVSGWVMQHGEAAVVPDIYADERVPVDVYLPTFVKSLAMVPIRRSAPLGAIGNYWASRHRISPRELELLQALADSTAVAMENVAVYESLEQRVHERTEELALKNQELARERERLIEVQRQRDALNALIVHDLKSPANAIMLAASMRLDSEGLNDQSRRDWSRVRGSAEQIHRTALDLLDIRSSAHGKLTVRPCSVDVAALLREVAELLRPQAERRQKTLKLAIDAVGVVRADEQLLRRVVQNLVDNALKHTPVDGVVTLAVRPARDGCVELSVSDSGPGIALEDRRRIFSAGTTLGSAADSSSVSHGLGLTFCRLAVEAHGGNIWVEDNEPRGSRFCLRLPPRGGCPSECHGCPRRLASDVEAMLPEGAP